jgi:HK97 family phage prohead protease
MNKETRFNPQATEFRVADTPEGKRLEGYAIVWNSRSVDLGGFVEVVAPTALDESLRTNPSVIMLRDHDSSIVLGRAPKTLTLSKDAKGLRFSCLLPKTQQADDLAVSIQRQDVQSCSFGFQTIRDSWSKDSTGQSVRTLEQINLSEISAVTFPAYPDTSVATRSLASASTADRDVRFALLEIAKRTNNY